MEYFSFLQKQDLLAITQLQKFQTKIGERLITIPSTTSLPSFLEKSQATYVLLGIQEDMGVKASGGKGGCNSIWHPFLQSFCNMQSNDFFNGDDIIVAGSFDFGALEYVIDTTAHDTGEKITAYKHVVNIMQDAIETLIKIITQYKKIPIVIGGGHNNAYALLKGAAKGWNQAGITPMPQLNALSISPFTHYNAQDGLHNLNAYRYAEDDGYLQKLFMLGLHENNIAQNVWMDIVNNPFIDCITYEDIFIHEKRSWLQSTLLGCDSVTENKCGIDLNINAIIQALSCYTLPVGITNREARMALNIISSQVQPAYLHLCEGSTHLPHENVVDSSTATLLAYLVSDFVRKM